MIPVILTRPLLQAQRFGAELRAEFGDRIDVIVSPLLRTTPMVISDQQVVMDSTRDVIFTSESGVEGFAVLADANGRRAFCVGDRTADAARAAGFEALSASGNSVDLLALVSEEGGGEMIYARGTHVARDLKGDLAALGIPVSEVIVYDQEPQSLSDAALKALSGVQRVIFPVFSPRTARVLSEVLTQDGGDFTAPRIALCLSQNVANQVKAAHFSEVIQSEAPNAAAMRSAFESLIA